jgi:hypothetical protein
MLDGQYLIPIGDEVYLVPDADLNPNSCFPERKHEFPAEIEFGAFEEACLFDMRPEFVRAALLALYFEDLDGIEVLHETDTPGYKARMAAQPGAGLSRPEAQKSVQEMIRDGWNW